MLSNTKKNGPKIFKKIEKKHYDPIKMTLSYLHDQRNNCDGQAEKDLSAYFNELIKIKNGLPLIIDAHNNIIFNINNLITHFINYAASEGLWEDIELLMKCYDLADDSKPLLALDLTQLILNPDTLKIDTLINMLISQQEYTLMDKLLKYQVEPISLNIHCQNTSKDPLENNQTIGKWLAKHNNELKERIVKRNLDIKNIRLSMQLLQAVKSNNIEAVKLVLQSGANVNVVDSFDMSPIDYAIRLGNVKMAEFLHANKAMLKHKHSKINMFAFHVIKSCKKEILEWIYNNKLWTEFDADITEYHVKAALGFFSNDMPMAQDTYGFTPVHYAILSGYLYASEKERNTFLKFLASTDLNVPLKGGAFDGASLAWFMALALSIKIEIFSDLLKLNQDINIDLYVKPFLQDPIICLLMRYSNPSLDVLNKLLNLPSNNEKTKAYRVLTALADAAWIAGYNEKREAMQLFVNHYYEFQKKSGAEPSRTLSLQHRYSEASIHTGPIGFLLVYNKLFNLFIKLLNESEQLYLKSWETKIIWEIVHNKEWDVLDTFLKCFEENKFKDYQPSIDVNCSPPSEAPLLELLLDDKQYSFALRCIQFQASNVMIEELSKHARFSPTCIDGEKLLKYIHYHNMCVTCLSLGKSKPTWKKFSKVFKKCNKLEKKDESSKPQQLNTNKAHNAKTPENQNVTTKINDEKKAKTKKKKNKKKKKSPINYSEQKPAPIAQLLTLPSQNLKSDLSLSELDIKDWENSIRHAFCNGREITIHWDESNKRFEVYLPAYENTTSIWTISEYKDKVASPTLYSYEVSPKFVSDEIISRIKNHFESSHNITIDSNKSIFIIEPKGKADDTTGELHINLFEKFKKQSEIKDGQVRLIVENSATESLKNKNDDPNQPEPSPSKQEICDLPDVLDTYLIDLFRNLGITDKQLLSFKPTSQTNYILEFSHRSIPSLYFDETYIDTKKYFEILVMILNNIAANCAKISMNGDVFQLTISYSDTTHKIIHERLEKIKYDLLQALSEIKNDGKSNLDSLMNMLGLYAEVFHKLEPTNSTKKWQVSFNYKSVGSISTEQGLISSKSYLSILVQALNNVVLGFCHSYTAGDQEKLVFDCTAGNMTAIWDNINEIKNEILDNTRVLLHESSPTQPTEQAKHSNNQVRKTKLEYHLDILTKLENPTENAKKDEINVKALRYILHLMRVFVRFEILADYLPDDVKTVIKRARQLARHNYKPFDDDALPLDEFKQLMDLLLTEIRRIDFNCVPLNWDKFREALPQIDNGLRQLQKRCEDLKKMRMNNNNLPLPGISMEEAIVCINRSDGTKAEKREAIVMFASLKGHSQKCGYQPESGLRVIYRAVGHYVEARGEHFSDFIKRFLYRYIHMSVNKQPIAYKNRFFRSISDNNDRNDDINNVSKRGIGLG